MRRRARRQRLSRRSAHPECFAGQARRLSAAPLTFKIDVLSQASGPPISLHPQPKSQHEQRQALRHSARPPGRPRGRGIRDLFPVRRIWCVGRNYLEHIKEMGQDEREPPFFFAKPADALVPDNGTSPYPSLTKDMHHEVELVVALKSGGRNIPVDKALDCVWGYGVGIDLTRRDLQIASRDIKRPWEVGKAFDASAPCGPLKPASQTGHPSKGKITLKCNGKVRQDGDLAQMIWNVPEVISKLSEMVALEAGDIIMTGTPSGSPRPSPATSSNARSRACRS